MSSMSNAYLHHKHAGVAEREAAQPTRRKASNKERVLVRVERDARSYPDDPATAAEIAEVLGLEHVEVQRRLSDLAREGKVVKRDDLRRRCRVKGTTMAVWTLAEGQGQLL